MSQAKIQLTKLCLFTPLKLCINGRFVSTSGKPIVLLYLIFDIVGPVFKEEELPIYILNYLPFLCHSTVFGLGSSLTSLSGGS